MLTPGETIAAYEGIAGIMSRMRLAAQSANWKLLAALERDCAVLVSRLQDFPRPDPLPPIQQRRKFDLLRTILAEDAEIRRHTEPWMENLKSLITSTGKARRVNLAYGVGANSVPIAR